MIYFYSLILHNSLFLLHLLYFYALMFHQIIVLLMFVLTYTFEIWTRMGDHHPQYPIFEVHYDKDHWTKCLSKLQEDLVHLRLRTHQSHRWDERYRPYIQRAGFLEIVWVFNTGLMILDPTLLTAAVDRYDLIHVWWSTKHWFVSLFELKNFLYWIKNQQVEMTTMQDVKMILCLRLGGLPVTRILDNDHWMDLVEQFYDKRPPKDEDAKRAK